MREKIEQRRQKSGEGQVVNKSLLTRKRLIGALLAGGAALGLWHLNSEENKADKPEAQNVQDDAQADDTKETFAEPDVKINENDTVKLVLPGNLPHLAGEIKTLGEARREKFSQFKELLHKEMPKRLTDEDDVMYLNRQKMAEEELQKSPSQLREIAQKIQEKFPNISLASSGDRQIKVSGKIGLDHSQMTETGFELLPVGNVQYIELNDDGTVRLSDDSVRYYAAENVPLSQLPEVMEQYLLLFSAMDAWRNDDHGVAPTFEEYLQILGAENLVTLVKPEFLKRIDEEQRDMNQEEMLNQKKDLLLQE